MNRLGALRRFPRSVWISLCFPILACAKEESPAPQLRPLMRIQTPSLKKKSAVLKVEPLTPELRAKGFSECNPYDPLGLGPYAPFARLPLGKILIPQKGGHTSDMGYDVLIHFNGADAVRKLLVQTAGGMVLVLVDKGTGGGRPYGRALGSARVFPQLRASIEKALQGHSASNSAHIRKLAVSSWSAGTAAIGKLLAQNQPGIDAIVILDGLHGAWKQGKRRVQQLASLDERFLEKEIAFARRAKRGEVIFVLTHSAVDPVTFPATSTTAHLLLSELGGLQETLSHDGSKFQQLTRFDEKGLHVWGYAGNDQPAHCAQLFVMPRIVREVLESSWQTPAMDRSVSPTPHPDWKYRKTRKGRR